MFRNQFFLVCFRGGNWRKRNLEFNFFFCNSCWCRLRAFNKKLKKTVRERGEKSKDQCHLIYPPACCWFSLLSIAYLNGKIISLIYLYLHFELGV